METIINAKGLGYKAGYRYLLQDINWEVKRGEHWVVFGMNGSGKTTLLSLIAGFKEHTHGELTVFNQSYNGANCLALRKKIGWVSSSYFDKWFTEEAALDIVLSGVFGTLGLGYPLADHLVIKAKILLSDLGLGDKIYRPFDLLSKGERQNVLIARALIADPELLVLDEPGTGLDVLAREYMLSTVRDLAQNSQITIIYVTHYTEEILDIFSNCLLLKSGRIHEKGLTKELFHSENLSSFLNYPVEVHQTNGHLSLDIAIKSRIKGLLTSQIGGV